jgi:hypothetical protein
MSPSFLDSGYISHAYFSSDNESIIIYLSLGSFGVFFVVVAVVILVILGFELRALYLLSKHSTT